MGIKLECELKSDLKSLAELTDGIEDLLRRAGISSSFYNDVLIAVDEIFSNIMIHGYKNEPGGSIRVSALIEGNKFEITFADDGVEFEPRKENPKLGKALLTGEYPGLGLFITRNLMDEFHYEHVKGENRTRLVKNFPGGNGKT
jgi:serine/threonine-protein kinase RsbW